MLEWLTLILVVSQMIVKEQNKVENKFGNCRKCARTFLCLKFVIINMDKIN